MQEDTLKNIVEQFSLFKLVVALVFFGLTWAFVWGMKLGADLLAAKFGRYRIFISSLFPVLRLGIWIGTTAFVVFAVFNPPLNTLLAISASAGLALGLGAQDLIKNIIAGIVILFDRPFRVGDMIDAGGHYGEVRSIGLRSTRIQTFDDSTVTLPNSMVLGQAVSNSNAGELDEMVVVEFHLPASVDVGQARELAREAAACSPYVFLKKPIVVAIEDRFDRTFLTRMRIKVYVLDIRLERLVASDITERLKQALLDHRLLDRETVIGLAALPSS